MESVYLSAPLPASALLDQPILNPPALNMACAHSPVKAASSCLKMANLATKLDVHQLKTIVWMDPTTLIPSAVPTESALTGVNFSSS